jgi:hypothetical protein
MKHLATLFVFALLVVSTVRADAPLRDYVEDLDYGSFNIQKVPIDISGLGLNPQQGDILYSETSATLVAIDAKTALYLDFNVPFEISRTACIDDFCKQYNDYRIAGKADDFIMRILPMNIDAEWKQVAIWQYLGVDDAMIRLTWIKIFDKSKDDYVAMENWAPSMSPIGVNIEQAINKGLITADYTPQGYSSLQIIVEAKESAAVNIPIGQAFENAGGKNQNLGAAEPVEVFIPKGEEKTIALKTYCINAHKGVPSSSDSMAPKGTVAENVKTEMYVQYATGAASTGAAQSAVWKQTDYGGAPVVITDPDVAWALNEENDAVPKLPSFLQWLISLWDF